MSLEDNTINYGGINESCFANINIPILQTSDKVFEKEREKNISEQINSAYLESKGNDYFEDKKDNSKKKSKPNISMHINKIRTDDEITLKPSKISNKLKPIISIPINSIRKACDETSMADTDEDIQNDEKENYKNENKYLINHKQNKNEIEYIIFPKEEKEEKLDKIKCKTKPIDLIKKEIKGPFDSVKNYYLIKKYNQIKKKKFLIMKIKII